MLGRKPLYSEEKVKTTLSLTPTAREWLNKEAEKTGAISVSDYLERLARAAIEQEKAA